MNFSATIITTLLLTSFITCFSQDTLSLKSSLSVNLKGQHNLAAFVDNLECYHCPQNQITDNPLHHLGIYLGLTHKLTINNKYIIESGIFTEERSYSGGNNTLSNLIFFPKIKIEANDTIRLFKQKFRTKIKGGDFWDEDVDDILRLYNIDYHALQFGFSYDNWSLYFFTIGDLASNIGLDLHQLYRTSVAFDNSKLRTVFHLSYNELSTGGNRSHVLESDWNFSNYSKYTFRKGLHLQSQISLRLNKELGNSLGGVFKATYNSNVLCLTGGLRYYHNNFNQGYNGRQPRYTRFGEFIGDQIYPLKNYYRSYSQWAVFTHLPNSELLAIELTIDWEKHLFDKMYYFNEVDINLVRDLTGGNSLVFPFYNIGVECKFVSPLIGRISVTNKHMELRTFYQTSSASKTPFISLAVQFNLNNLEFKTRNVAL